MKDPGNPVPVERLLAHRAWVRRVAGALVAGEADAEDLAQEAWVRALQRGPREERAAKGWFRTVLRRGAWESFRVEARRQRREEAAARPEATRPTDDMVAEAEVHKRVVDAVLALGEPYRETLVLRYFHELPLGEVAGRQGVPLETVRTRVRRGLAQVREQFDAEERGDRRRWMALLLPLARRGSQGPSITAAGGSSLAAAAGVLAMTMKTKVAVGAVVVLLGLGLWALRVAGEGPDGNPDAGAGIPDPRETASVAALPEEIGPAPPPALDTSGPSRPILVLDPDGNPAEGAVLEYRPLAGTAPGVPVGKGMEIGRSREAGRAAWPEGALSFPGLLRAVHRHHGPGEALVASREADVTVRLRRGIALEGTVVDREGRPVAGAAVEADLLPATHVLGVGLGVVGSWVRTGVTDDAGRFRIAGLPPSLLGLLTARADGYVDGRVAWRGRAADGVRIVLGKSFPAAVRVRDGAGRPLDGASVWVFDGARLHLVGGAVPGPDILPLPPAGEGLYARRDLPAGWYSVLVARAGYRLKVEEAAAFDPGLAPVEVVLEETPGIRGRVVWFETKEPVAGVRVRALPLRPVPPGAPPGADRAWETPVMEMDGPFVAVTGEDGSYTIPVLGPGDRFQIRARGEDGSIGFASHPPYKKAEAETISDVWLHRYSKEVDYSGRVVSAGGGPVPGALVRGGTAVTTTGEDGRFRLLGRQAGASLEVDAPGHVAPHTVFAPGATPQGGGFGPQDFGDIEVTPLREVRGTVVDRSGEPEPAMGIWALPVGRLDLPRFAQFGSTFASDADGRLVLRLVPGHRFTIRPIDPERMGEVEVSGDAEEEFRLVVGPDPAARRGTIRGRLRLEDGSREAIRVSVNLEPEGGGSSGGLSGSVDPDGRFEIPEVPAGSWTLRVAGSTEIAGERNGVVVPAGGVAEVEIVVRRTEEPDGEPAEVRVRTDPAPEEGARLFARATGQPSGKSLEMLPEGDGILAGTVDSGRPCAVLVADVAARRAGLLHPVDPGAVEPATVRMVEAGTLLPPPWEHGTPPWWIEIETASGVRVYSGFGTALPVVPDQGYALCLPPGNYRVEVSTGEERRSPRSFEVVLATGGTRRLE